MGSDASRNIDTVYLVGGVFFSLGGFASVLQAVNAPTEHRPGRSLAEPLALVRTPAADLAG